MSKEEILKIAVHGCGGVGKSSIIFQFLESKFYEKFDPTIEDSYFKIIQIHQNFYNLQILDTAGTQQFTSMRGLYLSNEQGYIIVYSITDQSSFDEVIRLRDQIARVKDTLMFPLVLVGNKCDLEHKRVISTEEGEVLAANLNAKFIEASAKTNTNVDEIFHSIAEIIIGQLPKKKESKRWLYSYLKV